MSAFTAPPLTPEGFYKQDERWRAYTLREQLVQAEVDAYYESVNQLQESRAAVREIQKLEPLQLALQEFADVFGRLIYTKESYDGYF